MLLSGWALSAGLRVALVRAPDATALVSEATTHLAEVLRAAGFDAVDVIAETESDAREVMEEASSGAGAFATLYLRPVAQRAIDVWIADEMTLNTRVSRIELGSKKKTAASSRAIASNALDLLRAALLEVRKRPQRMPRYDHEAHAHR